jgi:hypothetical protein
MRFSGGSLLFLLHSISKMRPAVDGGSRFGIVLNGSALFTCASPKLDLGAMRTVFLNLAVVLNRILD